ncbi:hypothetical protein [Jiangella asiatica]|uniref:Uncharacterized protein n=1 Tax=Jiangella asiatica TaxID=2530372 RepID=A0A4R5DD66_9ACTN|nr:hypothetical protein [Jiangella asiatica]TDE09930.1 hypothetical protein E1269_13230 [Jiangella asiatica]
MHPYLSDTLAAEHRRELLAAAERGRLVAQATRGRPGGLARTVSRLRDAWGALAAGRGTASRGIACRGTACCAVC